MVAIRPIALPVTQKTVAPEWLNVFENPIIKPAFQFQEEASGQTNDLNHEAIAVQVAEAFARAERDGRIQGERAGKAKVEETFQRLNEVLHDLVEVRQRIFQAMEQDAIALSMVIAQTILGRELKTDSEWIQKWVREAVDLVAEGDEIEITVSLKDQHSIQGLVEEIAKENPRAKALFVKASSSIDNGCVVETKFARVDATLATRLETIANALRTSEDA